MKSSKVGMMKTRPDSAIKYNKHLVTNIFLAKERFHLKQAQLPIEEKIRILIELQKIDLIIRPLKDPDNNRVIWEIE